MQVALLNPITLTARHNLVMPPKKPTDVCPPRNSFSTLCIFLLRKAFKICSNLSLFNLTFAYSNLPESHTVFRILESLYRSQKVRQRVFGVSTDEGKKYPRKKERRLGAPALLREVTPDRRAAGEEHKGGEEGEPIHCDGSVFLYVILLLYSF